MEDALEEVIAQLPELVYFKGSHRLERTRKYENFHLFRGRSKEWNASMHNHNGQDFPLLGCTDNTAEGAVRKLKSVIDAYEKGDKEQYFKGR